MNGDLLTTVNFEQILEFHSASKAAATMCVREYEFQVPYGVVKTNSDTFVGLDEKPRHKFLVNAGIYVLEPDLIRLVPTDEFFDMTSLFKKITEQGLETKVFPIHEYWLDIGKKEDFRQANLDVKSD